MFISFQVSSVIYLDSPVGVGLSYAKDKLTAYKTGDLKTAKDSHTFLLKVCIEVHHVGAVNLSSVCGTNLKADKFFFFALL